VGRDSLRAGRVLGVLAQLVECEFSFIDGRNQRAHPFTWIKAADQILANADRKETADAGHLWFVRTLSNRSSLERGVRHHHWRGRHADQRAARPHGSFHSHGGHVCGERGEFVSPFFSPMRYVPSGAWKKFSEFGPIARMASRTWAYPSASSRYGS
jgi:hypothetical protein